MTPEQASYWASIIAIAGGTISILYYVVVKPLRLIFSNFSSSLDEFRKAIHDVISEVNGINRRLDVLVEKEEVSNHRIKDLETAVFGDIHLEVKKK